MIHHSQFVKNKDKEVKLKPDIKTKLKNNF